MISLLDYFRPFSKTRSTSLSPIRNVHSTQIHFYILLYCYTILVDRGGSNGSTMVKIPVKYWLGLFSRFFSILDMIAQKPMNIFALIDEESSLNYTTDETMLTKLKSIHGNNDLFEVTRQGTEVFFVKHFAGDVCYTVDGMLEKNRDTFHTDSLNVIGGSTNKFLVYLFNKEIKEWLHNFGYRKLSSREKYKMCEEIIP